MSRLLRLFAVFGLVLALGGSFVLAQQNQDKAQGKGRGQGLLGRAKSAASRVLGGRSKGSPGARRGSGSSAGPQGGKGATRDCDSR